MSYIQHVKYVSVTQHIKIKCPRIRKENCFESFLIYSLRVSMHLLYPYIILECVLVCIYPVAIRNVSLPR